MAHGYRITADDETGTVYRKTHDNGESTEVSIDEAGTEATGGVKWMVNVTDPNGGFRLDTFQTKQAARNRATQWMSNHPKGVTGPGGAMGAVNAMEDATNSIFTGGGRF